MENILNTVKKLLGVPDDYDCFDSDILIPNLFRWVN